MHLPQPLSLRTHVFKICLLAALTLCVACGDDDSTDDAATDAASDTASGGSTASGGATTGGNAGGNTGGSAGGGTGGNSMGITLTATDDMATVDEDGNVLIGLVHKAGKRG